MKHQDVISPPTANKTYCIKQEAEAAILSPDVTTSWRIHEARDVFALMREEYEKSKRLTVWKRYTELKRIIEMFIDEPVAQRLLYLSTAEAKLRYTRALQSSDTFSRSNSDVSGQLSFASSMSSELSSSLSTSSSRNTCISGVFKNQNSLSSNQKSSRSSRSNRNTSNSSTRSVTSGRGLFKSNGSVCSNQTSTTYCSSGSSRNTGSNRGSKNITSSDIFKSHDSLSSNQTSTGSSGRSKNSRNFDIFKSHGSLRSNETSTSSCRSSRNKNGSDMLKTRQNFCSNQMSICSRRIKNIISRGIIKTRASFSSDLLSTGSSRTRRNTRRTGIFKSFDSVSANPVSDSANRNKSNNRCSLIFKSFDSLSSNPLSVSNKDILYSPDKSASATGMWWKTHLTNKRRTIYKSISQRRTSYSLDVSNGRSRTLKKSPTSKGIKNQRYQFVSSVGVGVPWSRDGSSFRKDPVTESTRVADGVCQACYKACKFINVSIKLLRMMFVIRLMVTII